MLVMAVINSTIVCKSCRVIVIVVLALLVIMITNSAKTTITITLHDLQTMVELITAITSIV